LNMYKQERGNEKLEVLHELKPFSLKQK
jgi:hypothetical protein